MGADPVVEGPGGEAHMSRVFVDGGKPGAPWRHPWKAGITVGRAYDLLRSDVQDHLSWLQREVGYRMIRFHGIFHDDMQVCHRESRGGLRFTWHHVDKVLDTCVALGLSPLVEMNPMPAAIASGGTTMFKYGMNVSPPADWGEWAHLIREFTRHVRARYGHEVVKTWAFECWNEPDLGCFWTGTREDYFRLYREAALAVKSVDPAYRVGGPATSKGAWISEFLEYCRREGVPVDFVSTHQYPQDEYCLYPERKGSPHEPGRFFTDSVKRVADMVRASPFPDLPVLYSEWNTQSCGPGREVTWGDNPDVDTLFAASSICHLMDRLDEAVDMMAWWVASDIFEEGDIPGAPFSCTYGLLTIRGTPKASAHAFRFLGRLRGDRLPVASGEKGPALSGCRASWDGERVQILLWHHVDHAVDAVEPWSGEIELALPAAWKGVGPLRVLESTIAAGQGSAREAWDAMGRPENLTPAEEAWLAGASHPRGRVREVPVEGDAVLIPFHLEKWEVRHLEIGPVGSRARVGGKYDQMERLEDALSYRIPGQT